MNFRVVPGYEEELFGPEAVNWFNPADDRQAILVKSNSRRKIWQIRTEKLNVYVKRYEAGGVVGWVKRVFRSSPAAVEFKNHQLARAAGLNCPQPLAFAQKGWRGTAGASILITAGIEAAQPLDVYLRDNPLDDELLRLVAELMGKIYKEGLIHPDPHLGNFLIRTGADGQRELVLTDLQKLHRITPAKNTKPSKTTIKNLACCYAAIRNYLECEQREKFLGTLLRAAGVINKKEIRELIERIAWKQSLRRWAGRDRRSWGNNKYFQRIRPAKCWKGSVLLSTKRVVPGSAGSKCRFTLEQWLKALENPPGLLADAETVKDSQSSLVVRRKLTVGQVELDVHCKLFKRAEVLNKSPAQRAYENGFALLNRQIPTVMPLAWLSKRAGLGHGESILITETVPGAMSLEKCDERKTSKAVAELKEELGRYGFVHRDLCPSNVLVTCEADGGRQLLVSHCENIEKTIGSFEGRTGPG